MKKITIAVIAVLIALASCSKNTEWNDVYYGNRLVKSISPNNDTIILFDWNPAMLQRTANGRYIYNGYPCAIDAYMDYDHLDELLSLEEECMYTDTYYELRDVISPMWVKSTQMYELLHW